MRRKFSASWQHETFMVRHRSAKLCAWCRQSDGIEDNETPESVCQLVCDVVCGVRDTRCLP